MSKNPGRHIGANTSVFSRFRRSLKPYVYFLPALIVAYLFSYRPFVKTLANSVSLVNYSGRLLEFVGLENYRRLFADRNFQTSLINTFRFTALFVPIDLVVCLICALLVYRKRRFNAFNETLFILPMAVAMTSAAIAFKALFNPTIGVINHVLGIQIQWFNDPTWAMTTIVVLSVWMALGFDFLLLLAALRSVPRQLIESAQLEGADRASIFFRIQLPLISPTLLFIVTTRIRDGMLLSGPVLVMTEGGPFRSTQTLIYQMYIEGFKSGNYSTGSAISVVVFGLTFLMILLAFRLERKGVFYQ
ncbi:MAG: sugar ABC transporter permease [Spirochaetae bacterium HGW-Spirochaetae-8]|nr:MAG: sugar ABC transporter permease [Spirochaetae bacterium HGW-Spirochaetae-8]